jgi:hypothetical protein
LHFAVGHTDEIAGLGINPFVMLPVAVARWRLIR